MTRQQKRAQQKARAHPIAWFLRRAAAEAGKIHAPATVWLFHINRAAPDDAQTRPDWPKTPQKLARVFGELAEGLAILGVEISRSRAQIGGRVHRVWRVESVFTPSKNQKALSFRAPGFDPKKLENSPAMAPNRPIKAENDAKPSDHTGAPKMPQKRRKITAEQCRRITPAEARHVGAATVETDVANTNARRLWAICPQCGARVRFLYQKPDAPNWACRSCHALTTKARQQRGTRRAFEEWLTPRRWECMSQKHPATGEFSKAMAADWEKTVAPFQWEKITAERRAELLQTLGNRQRVQFVFEERRWQWSARFEERGQAVGEQIRADLWIWWKHRNRIKKVSKNDTEF